MRRFCMQNENDDKFLYVILRFHNNKKNKHKRIVLCSLQIHLKHVFYYMNLLTSKLESHTIEFNLVPRKQHKCQDVVGMNKWYIFYIFMVLTNFYRKLKDKEDVIYIWLIFLLKINEIFSTSGKWKDLKRRLFTALKNYINEICTQSCISFYSLSPTNWLFH